MVRARASNEGATVRYEVVAAEGPVPAFADVLLGLSLAPGRDGLVASLDGRTEYLTPDDLLAHQAYRHGLTAPVVGLSLGVDVPLALAILADRFGSGQGPLAGHRVVAEHDPQCRWIRVRGRRRVGRHHRRLARSDGYADGERSRPPLQRGHGASAHRESRLADGDDVYWR